MVTQTQTDEKQLTSSVITLTLTRLVVNMTRRFGYPFAGAIASELSVPLLNVQNVLSLQVGLGVTSPLFGGLSERYGRKRVMLTLTLLMAAAAISGALLPSFGVFVVVMLTFGFAKMIIDPTVLAYIGDRVPYHRRGLVIAATELGWAGALLVAAPLVGFLLEYASLQAVFVVFALMLSGIAVLLWLRIPDDTPLHPVVSASTSDTAPKRGFSVQALLNIGRKYPAALITLAFPFCISTANEIFFINYGIFMEVSFGLALAALGVVTIVVSAAEIGGEVSVMGLADRFGKRRIAIIGTLVSSFAYLVLPHLSFSLPLALVGIFVMFLFVEIGIVAALPIFTEMLPQQRSVMMSGVIGMASLGRLVGGASGSFLYALSDSFALIGLVACVIGLVAALVMVFFVRENLTGQ